MSGDTFNDILIECAKLRGCYPFMHRTLDEFNWFCGAVIWGKLFKDDKEREICVKYNEYYVHGDSELIVLAKVFLEYCKEEYGNMELFN